MTEEPLEDHEADDAADAPTDDPTDDPIDDGLNDGLDDATDAGLEEAAGAPEVATGHPAVDEVLRSLQSLDDAPVDEHVAVFEQAHDQLRRTLQGAGDDE